MGINTHIPYTRKQTGFTIVELLIVIVVIAILAAITIVSYNGIQQRSQNTSIIATATTWYKTFKLYEADIGKLPTVSGCLGSNYPYDREGNATGTYQCRQDTSTTGLSENATLNTTLQPYMSNRPTPPMVTGGNSATVWRRGIQYYVTGSAAGSTIRIDVTFSGQGECPSLSGIATSGKTNYSDGNSMCPYVIGTVQ